MEALDAGGTAEVELEELRHEKELQKEEMQKLQAHIQTLRSEIQVHKVLKSRHGYFLHISELFRKQVDEHFCILYYELPEVSQM